MISRRHREIDAVLIKAAKLVRLLTYLKPINSAELRREFLAKQNFNPKFAYRELQHDPKKLEQELESLEIPDDELGRLLEEVRKRLVWENRMMANLGNAELVKAGSLELFGEPNSDLVADAVDILKNLELEVEEEERTVDPELLVEALEAKLREIGLHSWEVCTTENALAVTTYRTGKIVVPLRRKFQAREIEKLCNHEIGAHALRAENAMKQDLSILSIGTMGYWATEEGIAVYCEEMTGTLRNADLVKYAARVVAVNSVHMGSDFKGTFSELMSYGRLNAKQAVSVTLRAHRGGGYYKDMSYLEGYRKIKKFAESGGNLEELFVGKIALEQLPLINKLVEQDALKKAKHLPWFF